MDAKIPKVVVFSLLQKNYTSGKYREEVGITRLWGNSQWHVIHRNMLYKLVRPSTYIPPTEWGQDDGVCVRIPFLLWLSHFLHGMLCDQVSTVEIAGLLFSYKHTAIPDESYFSAAVVWLHQQDPRTLPLTSSDKRYWNEGTDRDISAPGELKTLKELADMRSILLARKSNTAFITCNFTNILMGLDQDCNKYHQLPDIDQPPQPAK